MGTPYRRWLELEQQQSDQAIELAAEQVKFIEKQNPAFRDRHVESSQPGELLRQDAFQVGHIKGVRRVSLHVVVDTYGSYAFGFLHTTKRSAAAVAIHHNDVLPFYQERDIPVGAILDDNGREFCGTESHPFELYLACNDIERRRIKVRKLQTNGFVERFNRTVLDEFFRSAFRTNFHESAELLQTDLEAWLAYCNLGRLHQGYRYMGHCPIDTVNLFLDERVRCPNLTSRRCGAMPMSTTYLAAAEARRLSGDRIAILGGVDVDSLVRRDEHDVRAYPRRVPGACMPGGGCAPATGNSVANHIPIRNYLAMLDEGMRSGAY